MVNISVTNDSSISTPFNKPTTMSISSPSDDVNIHSVVTEVDPKHSQDLINNEFVQIFFYVLYATVFVLGVFGNVLVCYVVLRNRAMQTVTNIFITNLALSDILLCTLAVPFTPIYTFMGRWAFGQTLCHLVSFAQGCSIYISTLTLTSIAVDRYFVICYPFHPRMKMTTCIGIVLSIWIISLLATLPYGMYMKVVSDEIQINTTDTTNNTVVNSFTSIVLNNSLNDVYMSTNINITPKIFSTDTYCEENWPSEEYRKIFGSATTFLQFVLPFVIISICYVWISIKLNARARAKPGSKSSRRDEVDRDRKKRTNHMLIAMVAVFGLSWLPINVVNIFDDFYEKSNEWRLYTLFFFIAHSIAMSSTCYNPFLYAWLNENFRKEFKHVLPCFNPSNNNILNITRTYTNRNTCGPRLHRRNDVKETGIDADDNDNKKNTLSDSLRKDTLGIVSCERTKGNEAANLSLISKDTTGVHTKKQNENSQSVHRYPQNERKMPKEYDYTNIDYVDEQMDVQLNETLCALSSENATTFSMMETSISHRLDIEFMAEIQ